MEGGIAGKPKGQHPPSTSPQRAARLRDDARRRTSCNAPPHAVEPAAGIGDDMGEWWPALGGTAWGHGLLPSATILCWAIPATAVAAILLEANWDPVTRLRRTRRFMGRLCPRRARELDREETRLLQEAARRAVLIVLAAGTFVVMGCSLSSAVALWFVR